MPLYTAYANICDTYEELVGLGQSTNLTKSIKHTMNLLDFFNRNIFNCMQQRCKKLIRPIYSMIHPFKSTGVRNKVIAVTIFPEVRDLFFEYYQQYLRSNGTA